MSFGEGDGICPWCECPCDLGEDDCDCSRGEPCKACPVSCQGEL